MGRTNSQLSGGGKLPSGYTKLNYIESTGTQYLNTGVGSNLTSVIMIDCQVTDNLNQKNTAILGGWANIGGSSRYALLGTNSNVTGWIGQWGSGYMNYGTKDNNRHTFIVNVLQNKLIIDSSVTNLGVVAANSNGDIALCTINSDGTLGRERVTAMKIYSCKMWDNGEQVRDFVPCLDNNNVPCLYDKIGKQTYYNLGSGTFLYE